MRVRHAGVTDTGRKRRRNEDAYVCEPPLFAVADGMGGAQAGEVASRLAAAALKESGAGAGGVSRVVALIRSRLGEQVARLMETGPALDPERLHQEAAILATRADIQEEIDRLGAHVEAARELLEASEPVGRRLDFLAQEFNREANTLCSKAADTALIRTGLALKAVIDQFREQVQNVQ